MEFEIYKVTICGQSSVTELAIKLFAKDESQARRFCEQHELSFQGVREFYFPVAV